MIDELKRRLKPHQSIVVFPAGSEDADRPVERFIEDGTVTDAVRHMERNFWLLERCGQEGQLCAQFTGVGINAANPGAFATTLVEHYAAKGYTFPLYGQIPDLKGFHQTRHTSRRHPHHGAPTRDLRPRARAGSPFRRGQRRRGGQFHRVERTRAHRWMTASAAEVSGEAG